MTDKGYGVSVWHSGWSTGLATEEIWIPISHSTRRLMGNLGRIAGQDSDAGFSQPSFATFQGTWQAGGGQ